MNHHDMVNHELGQQKIQPTDPPKSMEIPPTDPTKSTEMQPTDPPKSTEMQPTDPPKSTEMQPTDPPKSTEMQPTDPPKFPDNCVPLVLYRHAMLCYGIFGTVIVDRRYNKNGKLRHKKN